jgi:hypothetical protein
MGAQGLKPFTDQQANQPPSKEPTLAEFLRRRHWDLAREVSAIMSALTPREKELDEVQTAMQKLDIPGGMVRLDPVEVEGPTIKQMIVSALTDLFHEGASPVELRDYMQMTLGRDVDRNSISPQLARLREQGIVEQLTGPNEGKWKLVLRGVSDEELIAIGHWPPGAKHAPRADETKQPSGVKRRRVE